MKLHLKTCLKIPSQSILLLVLKMPNSRIMLKASASLTLFPRDFLGSDERLSSFRKTMIIWNFSYHIPPHTPSALLRYASYWHSRKIYQ